ncbi:hypothetical protein V8F33_004636 [Rhypophila sp. PSN 637]
MAFGAFHCRSREVFCFMLLNFVYMAGWLPVCLYLCCWVYTTCLLSVFVGTLSFGAGRLSVMGCGFGYSALQCYPHDGGKDE